MAYEYFPTFKRLFMDLILSYRNREDSKNYFEGLKPDDAYKLIEIELSWMYEILHSKGSVIYSFKHYGWISRVIILVVTTTALSLFALSDHTGYGRFETRLTYVLLGGAVGLEIIALVVLLLSFWTYAAMKKINESCEWRFLDCLSDFLFYIQETWIRPKKKPRWSNKMAQYSLITYSLEDQPCSWKSIMKHLGLKDTWDQYRYTTCVTVKDDLKDLVFKELKKKMNNIDDTASYRRFTDHRGQWALQRKGYYQEFGWSVEAEFDESILLWHIATDLLFHDHQNPMREPQREPQLDPQREQEPQPEQQSLPQQEQQPEPQSLPQQEQQPESQLDQKPEQNQQQEEISQHISNYMLFLLIVRPFMMPAGIGQIRFGDTCAEAANFLQPLGHIKKGDAVKKILDVNTEYDPGLIKGDRSKSVLFKGCMLAHNLKKEFKTMENGEPDWNKMWR